MPKVIYDTAKGLHQTTGKGFVGADSLQTLTGNDETITTESLVVRVDPGGGSRTGAILQAGTTVGQIIILVNVADAAENIDFADQATSNIGALSSANRTLGRYQAAVLVWTGSLWYLTTQSLS